MKNFTLFLIFVCTSFGTNLNACSCFNYLTFCEATDTESKLVEVEVLEKYGGSNLTTYMDIKIVESLQGIVDEEKLTVVSYGTSCDVFFGGFEIGQKLVISFKDLDPANAIANYSNFSFEACSTSYLQLSNNEVSGNIEPDVTVKNYDDFKNSIGACADLTLFNRNPEALEKHIRLIKNPTPDQTTIYSSFLNPSEISFELFSSNGQLITSKENLTNNSYPLDLSNMAVGVYFLRINYRKLSIVKKVVRM